jgi:protein Tob/BTG
MNFLNMFKFLANCYMSRTYQDPIMNQDLTMKLELQSASNFLVHLIKLGQRNINENQLKKFRLTLVDVLYDRFRDHWFPEKPFKGSGYRCIRINGKMDPVIMQAAESCDMSVQFLKSAYPSELTMWIDPLEVSYRIGENGLNCVLYEFKEGVNDPWRPNMNNTTRSSSSSKSESAAKKNEKNNSEGSTCSSASNTSSGASFTGCVTLSPPLSQMQATVPSKDSFRKMDYLLDPRKFVSIEQLVAYVSS